MPDPKKKIMHKFKMTAISTVDNPAQAGAKAIIMKRDDEDLAKAMFDEVLTAMDIEDRVYEAMDDMWKLNSALRSSIYSIIDDKDSYPDTIKSVKESVSQYVSAVKTLLSDSVDGEVAEKAASTIIPTLSEDSTADLKKECAKIVARIQKAWLDSNPERTSEDIPQVLKSYKEDSMPDPKTPTVEELAESLQEVNKKLLVAQAYGELNDIEKSHYAKLNDDGKNTFLGLDSSQRTAELAKITDADPVVYKTNDGLEIHKSDGELVRKLAEKADKNEEIAKSLAKAAETSALEKRVREEIPHIPGEDTAKVALIKAVEGIKDEETRGKVHEILKAHNDTIGLTLDPVGNLGEGIQKAEQELEKKVKEFQIEEKIPTYEQAYTDFLSTEEGAALYAKTVE